MPRSYEAQYEEDNFHHLPCLRCSRIVKRHIHPDALKNYKAYCYDCNKYLQQHPEELHGGYDSNEPISQLARYMFTQHAASPVKIYKPGDPGFDKLAEQYSLEPGKKHPYYNPFEGRSQFNKKYK